MVGDITELDVDAIVNAANSSLALGGGVAGAIRERGGPRIQEECDRIGGISVGGAAITTGGRLRARRVIHAVGPRWGEGDEPKKLRFAIANSLRLAEENRLKSVAFPAVSTGIFGFPIELAADIMIKAAVEHIARSEFPPLVIFCLYKQADYDVFARALEGAAPAES